jgi:muramoyltetrapeptide carboxypeptidase
MNRREILKALAALPFLANSVFGKSARRAKKIIKPKRLRRGDTVGLIAPAGYVDDEEYQRAVLNLENLGFKVKPGKNVRRRKGYLAGTDKERLEDLHWAFGDAETKAVWCVRGGYGVTRILPAIDYELVRKNPKIFIGYSDITALHLAISQTTGLVTFHGPVASSEYSDYTKNHALNVLMNPSAPYKIEISDYNKANESSLYKTQIITKGKARGELTGGNLSLLAALAGTAFALKNTKGKILFIEDVNEPPYKVDRMLTQLHQTIEMRALAGVAFGIFEDNNSRRRSLENSSTSLLEVLRDRLGDLKIPVVYGLSFGHIRDQFTLPLGIEAELDAENATLTFLESGVI